MLIKIGFDIELEVTGPTAMIYLLHTHPSRWHDLVQPERFQITPAQPPEHYRDPFGNHCGRINIGPGTGVVRFTNEAVVRDSGLPDPVDHGARQHAPHELPTETLQFVIPSRY